MRQAIVIFDRLTHSFKNLKTAVRLATRGSGRGRFSKVSGATNSKLQRRACGLLPGAV